MFKPLFIIKHNVYRLSLSENPNAIHLLEKYKIKINWYYLSLNPNAIPVLEKHIDRVNWSALSANPNAIPLLAKLDTENMRKNCQHFAEELAKYVFHTV